MNEEQFEKIRSGLGFFAALDQSGGSTPGALAEYGIPKDRYNSDAEMFDLVHAMRTRVITNPAFDGTRILAAILARMPVPAHDRCFLDPCLKPRCAR